MRASELKILALCFLMLAPLNVLAEIYGGIGPLETFGDVKAKYPRATFTVMHPAWAQESDSMYKVTGYGISGAIVIRFDDKRPLYRKMLERSTELNNQVAGAVDVLKLLASETDDEALVVGGVRWVPDSPIPLARFVSKYGKPSKSGFSDENMQPYREWESRGVMLYLADDEKNAFMVDYAFTDKERHDGCITVYGKELCEMFNGGK